MQQLNFKLLLIEMCFGFLTFNVRVSQHEQNLLPPTFSRFCLKLHYSFSEPPLFQKFFSYASEILFNIVFHKLILHHSFRNI